MYCEARNVNKTKNSFLFQNNYVLITRSRIGKKKRNREYLYEKYTNVHTTVSGKSFLKYPQSVLKKYSKELVNMLYIKELLYKSVRAIHGGLEYVNE